MNSSQNRNSTIILPIYQNERTVFKLNDVAMLTNETNFDSLNKKLNYAVRSGKLLNPRKGIYTKTQFQMEELACNIFTPSYISLEYVLQKSGIVFQYDSIISLVSYLSRSINVANKTLQFRKIKGDIMFNMEGIIRKSNHINIATPERAFLDKLYLDKDYYFDNLNPLNKDVVFKILPSFQSKSLTMKVKKLL